MLEFPFNQRAKEGRRNITKAVPTVRNVKALNSVPSRKIQSVDLVRFQSSTAKYKYRKPYSQKTRSQIDKCMSLIDGFKRFRKLINLARLMTAMLPFFAFSKPLQSSFPAHLLRRPDDKRPTIELRVLVKSQENQCGNEQVFEPTTLTSWVSITLTEVLTVKLFPAKCPERATLREL